MTDKIVWEDPPEPDPHRYPVADRLAPLRERPGEWARVHGPLSRQAAHNWAQKLNGGRFVGMERGDYEARTGRIDGQKDPDKRYVWARYVGDRKP